MLTDPDRERSVFAAHRAAAVGTTGFWRAAIFLLLLEDFRVEFLPRKRDSLSCRFWAMFVSVYLNVKPTGGIASLILKVFLPPR